MATYFFDANGVQIIKGLGNFDESRVAYTTTDENDIIFTKLPPGKKFKIVDGMLSIVEVTQGKASFTKFASNMRESALSTGFTVNCNVSSGGQVTRKTINVPVTEQIKLDVNFTISAFECGLTKPVPVKVDDEVAIVLTSKRMAMDLFLAGTEFVLDVTSAYRAANVLVNQGLSEEDFQTQVTALFAETKKTITI